MLQAMNEEEKLQYIEKCIETEIQSNEKQIKQSN